MKINDLYESTNLHDIVGIIKRIEEYYSEKLNKSLELKLNPDQTSSMRYVTAVNTIVAATISMVGDHYGTNNADEINSFVRSLMDSVGHD